MATLRDRRSFRPYVDRCIMPTRNGICKRHAKNNLYCLQHERMDPERREHLLASAEAREYQRQSRTALGEPAAPVLECYRIEPDPRPGGHAAP
jgi:hypothetical protein